MAVTGQHAVLAASERPPIEPNVGGHSLATLGRRLGRAGMRLAFCALSVAGGAAGGEALAYHTPTQVELLPGVSVSAQPSDHGSELSVPDPADFPLVSDLPPNILVTYVKQPNPQGDNMYANLQTKLPVIGNLGVHITLDGRHVEVNKINSNSLGGLLARPVESLEQPVITTLTRRIRHDMGSGALAGGAAVVLLESLLARLDAGQAAEGRERHLRSRLLLAGIAMMGPAASITSFETSGITPPANVVAGSQEVAQLSPLLSSVRFSNHSTLAALDTAVAAALRQQKVINQYYDGLDRHIERRFQPWLALPGTQAILHDPNLVIAADEGGIHCGIPFATKVAPLIMGLVGPRLLLMTGNIGFSSSSMPLQTECAGLQTQAIQAAELATGQKADEIIAPGTHDSADLLNVLRQTAITGANGRIEHPFTVLDGKLVIKAGIGFLGAGTPRQNPYGQSTEVNGKPATPVQQEEALYQSGQPLAAACRQAASRLGKPAIIMANSPEMGFAAVNETSHCASALLAGEGPAYYKTYNHANVLVQISAAGNGADCGFRLFEPVDQAGATIGIEAIDRATDRIVAETQINLNADGTVAPIAAFQAPPDTALNPAAVSTFLSSKGGYVAAADQANANKIGDPSAC